MTIRLAPYISDVAGASCRIHIILKRMCSAPACSHPAVRKVHHRPYRKTGITPLAPKRNKLRTLGERKLKPLMLTPAVSVASVSRYRMTQLPITNCVKPRSRPSRFRTGANPQSPGFQRPHVKHRSSLTPTRLPHEGHTTDPHFCLNMN